MYADAKSLADVILVCRSAGYFYDSRALQRAWVVQFLRDSAIENLVEHGVGVHFPGMWAALVDFCSGVVTARDFCDAATVRSESSAAFAKRRRVVRDTSGDALWSVEPRPDRGPPPPQDLWLAAVEIIRRAAGDAYYDIDIKVEFEREYNLDQVRSLIGSSGFKHPSLRAANCLYSVSAAGFLSKPSVFGGPALNYRTYVYGSNLIRFDNSLNRLGAPFAGSRSTVHRRTGVGDANLHGFINTVLETANGALMADADGPAACGSAIRFTSFSHQDVYIQFTFGVARTHYTGTVFYLQADEFCQNDVAVKRETLTSGCRCDNRLLYWRLCASVTPINGTTIDEPEVRRVVTAALNAFRTVDGDGLVAISGFTAMAMPHMNDPATRPTQRPGAPPERMCAVHDWARRNAGAVWRMNQTRNIQTLMRATPRLLVVYRPVMMSASTERTNHRVMTQYMSYEDTFKKYVLVSRNTLTKGYGAADDCAVAYACGNAYLLFNRRNGGAADDDDGRPARLWRDTFAAPSCVYVHAEVLRTIGFNVTAYPGGEGAYGRAFEHTDPRTGDTCTVVCSTLVRVVDETNDELLEGATADGVRGLKPLRRRAGASSDSVLEEWRPAERVDDRGLSVHHRYRETGVDVSAFWPETRLVKIEFVDPALEHVCLAFFVTSGSAGGEVEPSLERIYKFTAFCVSTGTLPAPVLFTVQQLLIDAAAEREPDDR